MYPTPIFRVSGGRSLLGRASPQTRTGQDSLLAPWQTPSRGPAVATRVAATEPADRIARRCPLELRSIALVAGRGEEPRSIAAYLAVVAQRDHHDRPAVRRGALAQ